MKTFEVLEVNQPAKYQINDDGQIIESNYNESLASFINRIGKQLTRKHGEAVSFTIKAKLSTPCKDLKEVAQQALIMLKNKGEENSLFGLQIRAALNKNQK